MIPNPDFLNVVQKIYPIKNKPFFVGGQSGMLFSDGRDLMAAVGGIQIWPMFKEALAEKSKNFGAHRSLWRRDSNLPVETDVQ